MRARLRNPYVIFAVAAGANFIFAVDATIVAVGIPRIKDELHTTLGWTGWVLTGSMLTQAISMPIMGKLGDMFGHKRLFLLAVSLFALATLGASFAPNIYLLIACRLVQGVGGGGLAPLAVGIVGDTFTGKRRMTAVGLLSTANPLGSILGPNLGGLFIDHISWRLIFLVNVPIAVVLLVLAVFAIPKITPDGKKHRIDVTGAGLLAAAAVSFLYGMTHWSNHPEAAPGATVWLFFALAILFALALYRHERRLDEPMVDFALIFGRGFKVMNAFVFSVAFMTFAFFPFIPYYAENGYGLSATGAGLIMTPRFMAAAVASIGCSLLLPRVGYRIPLVGAMLLFSAGMVLLSTGQHEYSLIVFRATPVFLLVLILILSGIAVGTVNPAVNNAALDLMPERMSSVIGMRGMFRSMGGVVGTSTTVVVLSHFDDKVRGMEVVFFGLGMVALCLIPLVLTVPDTVRSRKKT